jgi:hypothetical protein
MKNRRTKVMIDSVVQWALVKRVLLHWTYFLVMIAVLLPLWWAILNWDMVDKGTTFREAVVSGWVRSSPLVVFFIAIVPIIVYDIFRLSHRFAGPVYRLHKAIKELAAGEEVPPIELRKDDFWKHVVTDFNVLSEQVNAMRKREAESSHLEPATCGMDEGH